MFQWEASTASTVWSRVLLSPFLFLSLRRNLAPNARLPLRTAFPCGEAVNLRATCAAISAPSASVGSSELCVTVEWATLAAERPSATFAISKLTEQNFTLKRGRLEARWIASCSGPWFVTLPSVYCMKALYHRGLHHSELSYDPTGCTACSTAKKLTHKMLQTGFCFDFFACIDRIYVTILYITLFLHRNTW